MEAPVGAEAGVVDQEIYAAAHGPDPLGEGGGFVAQIAGQHLRLRRQLLGERSQPLLSPGDEDEIVSASGERTRKLRADSRRSTGDQRRFRHDAQPIPVRGERSE